MYAGLYLPRPLHRALLTNAAHRFDDSKALTPQTRARLMRRLCTPRTALHDACGWAVTLLSARDVSAGMLKGSSSSTTGTTGGGGGGGGSRGGGKGGEGTGKGRGRGSGGGGGGGGGDGGGVAAAAAAYNLNAQATDATVELVRGVLARGVNVRELFVDTIGAPHTHQARLARAFPGIAVTVAKKADALFPCVSAASVCAKVTRDAALDACYAAYVASAAASFSSAALHPSPMLLSSSSPSSSAQTAAAAAAVRPAPNNHDDKDDDNGDGDGDGKDDDIAMADNDDDSSRNKSNPEDDAAGWGSGYPSDARCSRWLRRTMDPVFGWGNECRFSWSTARDMLESDNPNNNSGVRVDWHCATSADNNDDAAAAFGNYFAAAAAADGGGGDGMSLAGSARTDRQRRPEMDGWFGAPLTESIF